MNGCSEPGCGERVLAMGLCSLHYQRMRRARAMAPAPALSPQATRRGELDGVKASRTWAEAVEVERRIDFYRMQVERWGRIRRWLPAM